MQQAEWAASGSDAPEGCEVPGAAGVADPPVLPHEFVLPEVPGGGVAGWLMGLHADAAASPSARTQAGWVDLVGSCQRVLNSVAAAQDAALARLAAIDLEVDEDGTVVERAHGVGYTALDAPDLAAPVLGATHAHASRRVRLAVRCAGDGPAGSASATGLSRLHEAMRAGCLDGYQAGVVADEVELAPAEVAAAVVEAVAGYFGVETATQLKRRARRALARISPDLLRERASRARAESGLRRWVEEPGVDRWVGTFPSEEAAVAWAAVDELAHRYVTDGVCEGIERARGKALTDLVTGNATIEVVLTLTAPAGVIANHGDGDHGGSPDGGPGGCPGDDHGGSPDGGAGSGPHDSDDGAEGQDSDDSCHHEDRDGADDVPANREKGDPDDLVEVQGPRPSEPVLVPRGWLSALARSAAAAARSRPVNRRRRRAGPASGRVVSALCDPVTGALLDIADELSSDAYRPPKWLIAHVRARDGRCRFPGCGIAARFCDVDHVRRWPNGPTAARNLMCVCRRHHRIKQRVGWSVRLGDDGRSWWTDPTGRVRVTDPLDRLTPVVLPAGVPPAATGGGCTTPTGPGVGPSRCRPEAVPAATRAGPATTDTSGLRPSAAADTQLGVLDVLLEHARGANPWLAAARGSAARVELSRCLTARLVVVDDGCRSRTRSRRPDRRPLDDAPPF